MDLTEGGLLGGRLRYAQPRTGYRTGIEPVLLAASVPARPGARVLEAGTGAGAGLLCLLHRVPGVLATGVEIDGELAELARRNLRDNGLEAEVLTGDICRIAELAGFDHVFANPPWHDRRSTASPDPRRRRAKQAGAGELESWVAALARALRRGGSIHLVLPASQALAADETMAAAGIGARLTRPLLPKAGREPKLVLVAGTRGAEPTSCTAPGTVLHGDGGAFTPAIDAVLRCGAGFPDSTVLAPDGAMLTAG